LFDWIPNFDRTTHRCPAKPRDIKMISIADWLPPAVVGTTFTLLGVLKLYGLARGVVGGANKPFITKLCGT
jgi:hypothetical protein